MSIKDFCYKVSRELVVKTLVVERRSVSDLPITPKILKNIVRLYLKKSNLVQ